MTDITIPEEQKPRAVRGLALVFALSFLSLAGVLLTVTALGGLGVWTRWQFIGLFGVLECASGGANIILPNVWRLPIAETQTKRSVHTHLAPSVLLIPHWGAGARVAAGFVLIVAAAAAEGVGAATLGLAPLVVAIAWILTAVSMIVARVGVARPDLDVVQFVLVRPKARIVLPPLSIGASVLQFLMGIVTLPLIKTLPASALYQPDIGPSWEVLAALSFAGVAALGGVVWAWRGRIGWHAPAGQQREAQRYA
jgi:hypothetical protein